MRDAFPKPKPEYLVTLTCGCTVRTRDKPPSYRMRLMCRNNLGHGYALRWTTATDTTRQYTVTNPETT